jgi:hypothetical protein
MLVHLYHTFVDVISGEVLRDLVERERTACARAAFWRRPGLCKNNLRWQRRVTASGSF